MRLEQKCSVLFTINWSVLNVQFQLEYRFITTRRGIWVLLRRRRRSLYVCEEVGPHLVTSEPSKGGLMTTDALQQINQKV